MRRSRPRPRFAPPTFPARSTRPGAWCSSRVWRIDPAEVQPLREHDEIAGEPVASYVRALPGPAWFGLLCDRFVERPPVPRTAAIVLAVGADEQERMRDEVTLGGEVEVEQ